jgi:hypothetical protein
MAKEYHLNTSTPTSTPATWDAFVRASPLGTVYHSTAWLEALAEGMGQDIRIHTVLDNGEIMAGVVVRRAAKYGICLARKPWATAYTGPVVSGDVNDKMLILLLNELRKTYQHVRFVGASYTHQTCQPFGAWQIESGTTGLLDISDMDKLWNSFDRHARQRVRKAEAAGVKTEESACARIFYSLHKLTYERQGLPMPLSEGQVCKTLELARTNGILRLFSAFTKEGESASALVVLNDSKRAYFSLAASHPAHRKTDAVTLLWWRVMQEYAKTHDELDLVGMSIPSIARFKRSFSPRLAPVSVSSCYSTTLKGNLFRTVEWGKNWALNLRAGKLT